MGLSQEQRAIDAVIANAVHEVRCRAPSGDLVLGLVHALRIVRTQADATGGTDASQIDDLVRSMVLAEKLQRRAINPHAANGRFDRPGPTTLLAQDILGDAAQTCLLLDAAAQTPPIAMLTATQLLVHLLEVMDDPPDLPDIDSRIREPRPAGDWDCLDDQVLASLH